MWILTESNTLPCHRVLSTVHACRPLYTEGHRKSKLVLRVPVATGGLTRNATFEVTTPGSLHIGLLLSAYLPSVWAYILRIVRKWWFGCTLSAYVAAHCCDTILMSEIKAKKSQRMGVIWKCLGSHILYFVAKMCRLSHPDVCGWRTVCPMGCRSNRQTST